MKLLQTLGFLLKYLLLGLGIAALFIVFMPEKFSKLTTPKPPVQQQTTAVQPQKITGFADMLQNVQPAVVSIKARSKPLPLNSEACQSKLNSLPPATNACAFLNNGSGVFIDNQGHIVTNAHVINKAATIIVEVFQGQQFEAQVIGVDFESDIALLKIDLKSPNYLPLPTQDSSRVGDWVFTVGTPSMAFEQTVTQGIISAKFFSRVSHYIQTDAALRPGNSGGALVNTQGHLVGITSLSARNESGEKLYQSYAIVASNVSHIVRQLLEHGEVRRGWLGLDGDMTINIRSIAAELALTPKQQQQLQQRINQLPYGKGIVVTGITPQGPAEAAGLQPLDILTQVNHKQIYNSGDLISAIWNLTPETSVDIEVLRGGEKQTIEVTLGKKI